MKHSYHPFLTGVSAAAMLCVPFSGHTAVVAGTELKPKSGLPAFEYMEAPDRLPNYTPGARWGTQAEPITTMQKPLAPEI